QDLGEALLDEPDRLGGTRPLHPPQLPDGRGDLGELVAVEVRLLQLARQLRAFGVAVGRCLLAHGACAPLRQIVDHLDLRLEFGGQAELLHQGVLGRLKLAQPSSSAGCRRSFHAPARASRRSAWSRSSSARSFSISALRRSSSSTSFWIVAYACTCSCSARCSL